MSASSTKQRYKLFLLPAYVLFETTRATLTYAAVHSRVQTSSTLITFCSEFGKWIFTIIFLCRWIKREQGSVDVHTAVAEVLAISKSERSRILIWPHLRFAIPAALYLVNNILYLIGLQLTTPSLLTIAILSKLPITAILHHVFVKRQRSVAAWISLLILSLGLLISHIPKRLGASLSGGRDDGESAVTGWQAFLGPAIGLTIATISGFTSILTEVLLKQDAPFWVGQFWLYLWGATLGALTLCFWDGRVTSSLHEMAKHDFEQHIPFIVVSGVYASVVTATAGTGLVVANILRKQDNLVKLVGASASIVTIILAQCAIFADLRSKTWTVQTVLGAGIIALSTWTYHYHKQAPAQPKEYWLVPEIEIGGASDNFVSAHEGDYNSEKDDKNVESRGLLMTTASAPGEKSNEPLKPTLKRLSFASVCIAVLTVLTAVYHPSSTLRRGQSMNVYGEVNDIERFFSPHNITPAVWGETENPVRCVEDWVEREGILPSNSKLVDFETTFLSSGCPVYPIPTGGMIFHQYWRGPWRSFNVINIEAFLATQRFSDGHRMIYWYEDGGPPEEVRRRFSEGEHGRFIEFRELDRMQEAQGYCVADMPEYNDKHYQDALAIKQSTLSDIVRYLLLRKYGGIWLDSDTIPLRDLTPMIRAGPSACGMDQKNQWNNNVLVFGPADSGIAEKVLATTCGITYNETAYRERYGDDAIMPNMWWWIYNDGVLRTCELRTHCGINRHPIAFTDGVYFGTPGQPSTMPCKEGELFPKGTPFPPQLHGLWTWHARLGQFGDACIDDASDSLIAAIRRRVLELLANGIDFGGRDVLPGPGYTSR